ncbi:binding protein [[Candida] boidinii]|uniref:Unnamed protein product n=1 Tax=Candida boidinii TaxID=5477 RepID=A0ACB5TII1_CANBO|nr:binding protein [[Candida] boidinii]GME89030.1 unnamed protein product [[Candida] boidinii]
MMSIQQQPTNNFDKSSLPIIRDKRKRNNTNNNNNNSNNIENDDINPIKKRKALRMESFKEMIKKRDEKNDSINNNNNNNTNNNDIILKREEDAFSLKMYRNLIHSALDSLEKNDTVPIDTLTSQIISLTSNKDTSINKLNVILPILTNEISRLDNKKCYPLIQFLLKLKWLDYYLPIIKSNEISNLNSSSNSNDNVQLLINQKFVKVYTTFLSVLVSGIPKFWNDVTDKLIKDFGKKSNLPIIHDTLNYIIGIMPTSVNSLPALLSKNFPHKQTSKYELTNYVKNLLELTKYCEEVRTPVWSIIMDNCIKLDVELQNELDEIDDEDLNEALDKEENDQEVNESEEEEEEEEVAESEDDDSEDEADAEKYANDDTTANYSDEGEDDEDEDEEDEINLTTIEGEEEYDVELQKVSDLSGKLDSILSILMKCTSEKFTTENLESGNGVGLFNTLLSLFKSHVLPTHYTRCIQYLLFHAAQQKRELTETFLFMLIDSVFDQSEMTSNRIKAMQYISSFIARAKTIEKDQLLAVISFFINWCESFINQRESEINDGRGGMERFKMLYSVFQGLLYIVCFRYEELKTNNEWDLSLDRFFQRIIISKFNPLKYCNETVVLIFARISQQTDLCYCFSIIEQNKRERLSGIKGPRNTPERKRSSSPVSSKTSSSSSSSSVSMSITTSTSHSFSSKQEFLDLEAYFPFDPLMLKKSKKIINENYIEWTSGDEESESDES